MLRSAGVLLGLLLLTAPLAAEEVRLKKGKPLHGTVRRAGGRLLVNPYGCTLPAMTWGVVDLPAGDVESVEDDRDEDDLLAALDALPEPDVAGRVALLERARSLRGREVLARIAAEILRAAPDHAEGLEAIGGKERWALLRAGDPVLDLDLRREIGRLLRLEEREARQRVAGLVAARLGWEIEPRDIERLARSLREPRGARHDVPAAFAVGEELAGARFSLFVPADHHPLEPRPLVVALHGGVPAAGRDAPVLGSARDAFELFERGARRRRWILACPQAVEAPWSTTANRRLVDAVVEEVAARYAVDLARVVVVGHDTGADFALELAGRSGSPFAAVGAASAFEPGAARKAASRGAGVWLFHGEADEVVPVVGAREAAERLLAGRRDFVYCELPGAGHTPPADAEVDLYRHLATCRERSAREAWPRSSLVEGPRRLERSVLGDPLGRIAPEAGLDELLAALGAGGALAETAASRLQGLPSADVAPAATALLADRAADPVARSWAARLLGVLEVRDAVGALADVVRAETHPLLRRRAAQALGRLGAADAVNDLLFALEDAARAWSRPDPGDKETIPFVLHDETCHLLADLVEAIGRSATSADAAPAIEEAAVVGVLRDRRPVEHRPSYGEDPLASQALLAFAVGGAYGALGAEATLMDLLRVSLERRPTVLAAAEEGFREGRREWRRR